jgi:hypothetical protein
MDLETFLSENAGLSGPKLSAAKEACHVGMVTSPMDLLDLLESEQDFEKAFPQAMIRKKLRSALEKHADAIKTSDENNKTTAPTSTTSIAGSPAAIPKSPQQTEQQMQPQSSAAKTTDQTAPQLPPDKLYHFFASHKVRSDFEYKNKKD